MPTKAADLVSDLANQLERAILRGEYAVGERLPAERKLCEQLGVSRSVVREAIGRLASAGLVQSHHGSGTRVTRPSAKHVGAGYKRLLGNSDSLLAELTTVRLSLETKIVELAASHRSEDQLSLLEETLSILGNSRKPLTARAKADADFHSILAEATGNAVFPLVLAPIHDLLLESRRRTLGQYGSELAHQHHSRILEAIRRKDPRAAREAMETHLAINSEHLRDLARKTRQQR